MHMLEIPKQIISYDLYLFLLRRRCLGVVLLLCRLGVGFFHMTYQIAFPTELLRTHLALMDSILDAVDFDSVLLEQSTLLEFFRAQIAGVRHRSHASGIDPERQTQIRRQAQVSGVKHRSLPISSYRTCVENAKV